MKCHSSNKEDFLIDLKAIILDMILAQCFETLNSHPETLQTQVLTNNHSETLQIKVSQTSNSEFHN